MQVNLLDAKSQLASDGKPQVGLVPCAPRAGLMRPGALAGISAAAVPAF